MRSLGRLQRRIWLLHFIELQKGAFLRQQLRNEELEFERQLAEFRAGSRRSAFSAIITGRPPIHAHTKEAIDQALHLVDQTHWPMIAKMRLAKFTPLDIQVPPSTSEHLLNQIEWCASSLFKGEADEYEQFRSNEQHSGWLLGLVERVIARVLVALNRLEEGGPKTILMGYRFRTAAD
jgi:hypothetical protein